MTLAVRNSASGVIQPVKHLELQYRLSVNHIQGPEITVLCVYEEFRCKSLEVLSHFLK